MSKLIGIIIGSTRPKCNGKPIAAWIHKTILQHSPSGRCSYEIVDLAHWNLPLFDEPGVPARDAPVREHTKAWQAKVKTLDGFVFVTPQVGHKHGTCPVEADRSASTIISVEMPCCHSGSHAAFLCVTAVLHNTVVCFVLMLVLQTLYVRVAHCSTIGATLRLSKMRLTTCSMSGLVSQLSSSPTAPGVVAKQLLSCNR